jgi:hypothetical protein
MGVFLPSNNINDFVRVAGLIGADSAPPWLPEHLRKWTGTLILDRWVEIKQPTRAEMRSILQHVQSAAQLLIRALGSAPVREFLEAAPNSPFSNIGHLTHDLEALVLRAYQANNSAALVTGKGTTKAGRGKALPIAAISPPVYCALIVSETWRFFRGVAPAPKNLRAGAAAETLWRAAGGDVREYGEEPLARWRHHFKTAQTVPAEDLRAKCRRHLVESERFWKLLNDSAEEVA